MAVSAASLMDSSKRLRCLVCDDNLVLLNLQAMLLKRRFSHVLDGPPIAVDGGLKAIQALRQEVFDVVFLDIEMPHCSGLEVCRRIRAGTDGILEANRSVIILATTTAVGPVPSAVYRSIGMNGVLPKPVRAAHLASFLGALLQPANQRLVARGDGLMVRAAQEPTLAGSFFLPASDAASDAIARPDICDGRDFEAAIHEQTKASLRQAGQISRSTSNPGSISPQQRPMALRIASGSSGTSSASSTENLPLRSRGDEASDGRVRGNSVAISSRVLKRQLAHEVAQMHADEAPAEPSQHHDSATNLLVPGAAVAVDVGNASSFALPGRSLTPPPVPSFHLSRPTVHKRASSPAWLTHWDLASESFDYSMEDVDALVAEIERSKATTCAGSSSSCSTPTSFEFIGTKVAAAAASSSPQLARLAVHARLSEDDSDYGSGSAMGSISACSRSTAQSTFSPRSPSEASSSSLSYFPHFMGTHHANFALGDVSSERRSGSVCTTDTSANTSLASSPSLEAAPLLHDVSSSGLLDAQDGLCESLAAVAVPLGSPACALGLRHTC